MKLYKHLLTAPDAVSQDPELIMESENRDTLKRKVESLIPAAIGLGWVFMGRQEKDSDYEELTINEECRFVIRAT
jgi:hypothetical protein